MIVLHASGTKANIIQVQIYVFSGFGRGGSSDTNMAQLIADSTEKKFNFNPFKGMLKKKHYSFDFNN